MDFSQLWEQCFSWATSPNVQAGLQWLGTGITVFGLPIAVWKSWTAASAADRANKAVNRFGGQIRLGNVAYSIAQLQVVESFISSQNYSGAIAVFRILKRMIIPVALDAEKQGYDEDDLRSSKRNIDVIETQLSRANDPSNTFRPKVLTAAIGALGSTLIKWEGLYTELRKEDI